MSSASRRAGWRPFAGREPQAASITEAIEGLTDRIVAVRVSKEQAKENAMSDNETQQQPAAPIAEPAAPATPLPPAPMITGAAPPVRRPPPSGSFASSLRAMMDEAREGVQRARADGLAEVQSAVGKLAEAKDATAKVAGNLAQTIRDEAADVLAELGQISNDL